MKSDIEIVKAVNSCINLDRLASMVSYEELIRFEKLIEETNSSRPRVFFAGTMTGFHINTDGHIDTCVPEKYQSKIPNVNTPMRQDEL